jgi:hypothetical protein
MLASVVCAAGWLLAGAAQAQDEELSDSEVQEIWVKLELTDARFDSLTNHPIFVLEFSGKPFPTLMTPPTRIEVGMEPNEVSGGRFEVFLVDEEGEEVAMTLQSKLVKLPWKMRAGQNPAYFEPDWSIGRPKLDARKLYHLHVRLPNSDAIHEYTGPFFIKEHGYAQVP